MTRAVTGSTRKARFDALKLAADGETLSGAIDASGLDRVADRLAAGGETRVRIAWRIEGGHDTLRSTRARRRDSRARCR